MRHRLPSLSAVAVSVAILLATMTDVRGETRPIDVQHSTLTVLVYKSGLFSALADNHVISAPIASGSISEEAPLRIDLLIRSADLRVLDPGLAPERRADIQTRMLGSEVLDVTKFPEITFASTAIEPAGTDRWKVAGRATIHGQTRPIAFQVVRVNGKYRGEVVITQRDFDIKPIKVAGGAVKVKDELTLQFEIAR